jgi:hypothetical protein
MTLLKKDFTWKDFTYKDFTCNDTLIIFNMDDITYN